MNILALQLKRIGDLILTTPALHALRKARSDARITLAVEGGCEQLLPAIRCVDETLVYRRAGGNAALWTRMLCRRFDACLDFTGNDRSALFTLFSKAARRVGFERMQGPLLRPIIYNRLVDSSVRDSHTVDHYLDLLTALGIHSRDTDIALTLPPQASTDARQRLADIGVTGDFAVIHPGSARIEKFWVPERWAEVIEECRGRWRIQCVLTGTDAEIEREHLEKIQASLGSPCPSLVGRVDLLTLAALIREARLFLGVDSAPMHLAAAMHTPEVVLFGPTNPFHWRPRNDRTVVLLAGHAGPVMEFGPAQRGGPLTELSTGQVIDAIAHLLGSRS